MPAMRRLAALTLLTLLATACSASAVNPHPSTRGRPTAQPTPTPPPQLTLHDLFHPRPASPDPERERTLIATGDIIPARLVNLAATQRGDFLFPFQPTASYVRDADLTYVNLESPLLGGCTPRSTGMNFCGDPRFIAGLKAIGARVVNLANNHVYPGPSTDATSQLLRDNGMQVTTDIGPPVVLEARGLKFAFIGCNAVTGNGPVDQAALRSDIDATRRLVPNGVVVVQFHWGKEYERLPLPAPGIAPDDPVRLGHLAIDAGADLVIGNHPHWVQAVEIYHNHLITYAHGNYVFDQVNCWPGIGADYLTYCSDDTRTSVIGSYTFRGSYLVGASWKPTFTDPNLQTQFADPMRAEATLEKMETASQDLAHRLGEPDSL